MSSVPAPVGLRSQRRARRGGAGLLARGEPATWLAGAALVACLAMVCGLLALVIANGVGTFWPGPLIQVATHDGRLILGEATRTESYTLTAHLLGGMSPEARAQARVRLPAGEDAKIVDSRRLLRTGNYELVNEHFTWVADVEIAAETQPEWGVVVERFKGGNFYGHLQAYLEVELWDSRRHDAAAICASDPAATVLVPRHNGFAHERLALASLLRTDHTLESPPSHLVTRSYDGPEAAWAAYAAREEAIRACVGEVLALNRHGLGPLSRRVEAARLAVRAAKRLHGEHGDAHRRALDSEQQVSLEVATAEKPIKLEIAQREAENAGHGLFLATASGTARFLPATDVYRAVTPNRQDRWAKLALFGTRWGEFLTEQPREANSEGGVMPAIFGTVVMTLMMSIAVVPLGVLAALYLREYARAGFATSAVRIAVNNLAGVPSIVFGVFGLGFFCYGFGKYIDGGPALGLGVAPWAPGAWGAGILVLALVVAFGIACALWGGGSRPGRAATWLSWCLGRGAVLAWIAAATLVVVLLVYTPHFGGLFRDKLADGQPTFGTGGLMWASLTLALLTLPVVIVATEEALAAVPNSMREGSYACGASKWQTIWRIVLPRAMPGIMTGMILAIARGAGEVAPLMLVGAVKLAPDLPIDGMAPYIHPERSFMHLGFHIYDVAFQSQNSEAAKPIVYSTTLLLIAIIGALNLTAIWLRARLRRRLGGGHF